MKKPAILIVLGALVCAVIFAGPFKGNLVIKNTTGKDLNEMFISAASEEEDWEEANLLEGKVLKNGKSITISKSVFTENDLYDFTFTSTGDDIYYIWEVNIAKTATLTVTRDHLDTEE